MKTFNQFLSESFSPSQFPNILKSSQELEAFDTKAGEALRNKYLPKTIEFLNKYATGDVPNPSFQDAKHYANRTADYATKFPAYVYAVVRGNRDIDTYDFSIMSLHVVPGKLKKAQARLAKASTEAEKVFFGWLVPVLTELLPIANAMENMKGRIVKRQAKAPEDTHAKYVAPMMRQESGKLVIDALTEITKRLYDDFARDVTQYLVNMAEEYAGLTYDEQEKRRVNNPILTFGIWEKQDFYSSRHNKTPMRLVRNFRSILEKKGIEAANDMQESFVYKNAKKLANIIEVKSSPLVGRPEILNARTSTGGIFEGELRLVFADHSRFDVRNKVIWKMSQYGKTFNQYPTTFHNVMMPNGKPMGQPSEERMNTIFAKG